MRTSSLAGPKAGPLAGPLAGKALLITGGSRGIGKAIALRAARDGAKIALLAKTSDPHPKLQGTIHSAAEEIRAAGGEALPLAVDIRFEDQVAQAVEETVRRFGGIDILVNNASAISLTDTASTPIKRFDLMHSVNTRGTFVTSQACMPHLEKAANPHILTLAPPPTMEPKWYAPHLAYTLAKMGMSLCVLGMAEELRGKGIAVNGLWPRTLIATAAIEMLGGAAMTQHGRTPEIVADAAHAILSRPSRECTGNFFIDEAVLRETGLIDFERYAVEPGAGLQTDLFL